MTVAILTVSDSVAGGRRVDQSGPALAQAAGQLGWSVIEQAAVPDEQATIAAYLQRWADELRVSVILTTGGTGVAARDVTPEATRSVLARELPGLAELMRAKSLEATVFAPLSRAVAGTRGTSVIVNLPGSPRGAVQCFAIVQSLLPHVVDLLQGRTEHQNATL